MPLLVENLLGKDIEVIKCSEFLKRAETITESPYVELKSYHRQSWKEIREDLMKSTVGFLNGLGEGLLVLGFDEKSRKPTPIPSEALQLSGKTSKLVVESKLRDTILTGLKSIPPSRPLSSPILKVKVLDAEECGLQERGYVILVYVARTFDALYYYGANLAYVRQGSTTRLLSLEEIFNIVEFKSKPVLVLLSTKPAPAPSGGVRLNFVLKNLGTSPAMNAVIVMVIPKSLGKVHVSRGLIVKDASDALVVQRSLQAPFHIILYPDINMHLDFYVDIEGYNESTDIYIEVSICSESTRSIERLMLTPEGNHIELEVLSYRTSSIIYRGSWTEPFPSL